MRRVDREQPSPRTTLTFMYPRHEADCASHLSNFRGPLMVALHIVVSQGLHAVSPLMPKARAWSFDDFLLISGSVEPSKAAAGAKRVAKTH